MDHFENLTISSVSDESNHYLQSFIKKTTIPGDSVLHSILLFHTAAHKLANYANETKRSLCLIKMNYPLTFWPALF